MFAFHKNCHNFIIDTIEEATAACEKRRPNMPAVYSSKTSSGRTTDQLHLITPQEFDVAMATTSTELIGRAETKIEGFRNEVSGLRKRCANPRPQGEESIVDINDSDIEDIQDDIGDVDSDFEWELLMPKPVKKEPTNVAGDSADDVLHPINNQNVAGDLNSLPMIDPGVAEISGDGMQPISNETVVGNLNSIDGDMQKSNDPEVVGNSDGMQPSNNQSMFEDSNIGEIHSNEEADGMVRNDVSPSSESTQQAIEDVLSGNLHYVEDVSILYEVKTLSNCNQIIFI